MALDSTCLTPAQRLASTLSVPVFRFRILKMRVAVELEAPNCWLNAPRVQECSYGPPKWSANLDPNVPYTKQEPVELTPPDSNGPTPRAHGTTLGMSWSMEGRLWVCARASSVQGQHPLLQINGWFHKWRSMLGCPQNKSPTVFGSTLQPPGFERLPFSS